MGIFVTLYFVHSRMWAYVSNCVCIVLCVSTACVCAAVPCCFVIKAEVKSNFPYFAVLEVNCESHAAPGKLSSILVLSCANYKIVSGK